MEPVQRLHDQHADQNTNPSVNDILKALRSVLSGFSTLHFVVDALDECQDDDGTRHLFLDKLRTLRAVTDVRLMVTSRSIPDVVNKFQKALRLEVRAKDQDMTRFVHGQIYRLPKCIQRDIALQEAVKSTIVEAAGGM
jgi:hypothetical protein